MYVFLSIGVLSICVANFVRFPVGKVSPCYFSCRSLVRHFCIEFCLCANFLFFEFVECPNLLLLKFSGVQIFPISSFFYSKFFRIQNFFLKSCFGCPPVSVIQFYILWIDVVSTHSLPSKWSSIVLYIILCDLLFWGSLFIFVCSW